MFKQITVHTETVKGMAVLTSTGENLKPPTMEKITYLHQCKLENSIREKLL